VDRLHISDTVLAQLSPDDQRRLRHGDDAQPGYECVVCGRAGDRRTEDTSLCLVVGITDSSVAVIFTHEACAPSRVYSARQLRRWTDQHQQARAAVTAADVVGGFYTTRALVRGRLLPVLVITASDNAELVLSDGTVRDSVVIQALRHGFTPAPPGLAWHALPPRLPGWTVHVEGGRLHRITRPGGTWWTWPGDPPPPVLDQPWVDIAGETGHSLVAVTGRLVADRDEAAFRAALATAATAGRLAAALVPTAGL
jgi:hypothetical protein